MYKCQTCGYDKSIVNMTVRDLNSETTKCPNCWAIDSLNHKVRFENNPALICDITGKNGAVEFIAQDEYYCVNAEAMVRLIAHNLFPNEYLALAKKYGEHKYMIHGDFYTENGMAIQPSIPDDEFEEACDCCGCSHLPITTYQCKGINFGKEVYALVDLCVCCDANTDLNWMAEFLDWNDVLEMKPLKMDK